MYFKKYYYQVQYLILFGLPIEKKFILKYNIESDAACNLHSNWEFID